MSEPIHVTDAAFEKAVLLNPLPVIVDFWAPWCGPCKVVGPMLDKIAKEMGDKLVVAKVNTDENPQWATQYGVQGIPTMLFIYSGKIVHRQVGALPERLLREAVTQFMEVTVQPKP
ncbi:MAG: thioredoxin [Anaerolineales bacterium]|nr:thioredoxin [Anaerolineales bacterium]